MKFAKYLKKEHAIDPIVLTRKDIAYHSIDRGLIKEVNNIRTIRTESFDPARLLYLTGMKIYRPKKWQKPIKRTLNFPDHKIAWLPCAYNAGIQLKFDCVFVTAPPFSAFIIGYLIAKKSNKPLILDFRDAWLDFPFLPYTTLQKKFVAYWERKLLGYAPLITVVDDNIKNDFKVRYPEFVSKIVVIPNGYDPPDFAAVKKPSHFTISYLGTIRSERNPENFLKAVDLMIKEKQISASDIKVKFIGHIEETFLQKIEKYLFTEIYGHLPYTEAIREFSASHLCFLSTTGSKYFFPSRQNEYLATGLPIIVCGKSQGIHLLQTAFNKGYPGWIYDFNDITGIKRKILELYAAFQQKKFIVGQTPYTEYTRQALTKRLVEHIKKIPV